MKSNKSPWAWIPTLYVAEGLPYFAVMTISVMMYKRLGVSNTDIALYTGWLYLPWVIKPFWSPFVDIIRTKRWWILSMQWLIGIGLACVALALPLSDFFRLTLAAFWLVGFASATHDIAADGYYMLALSRHEQSLFVGIRSLFYRVASVIGQGGLVVLAGVLEERTGRIALSWSVVIGIISVFFIAVAVYHALVLPRPVSDMPAGQSGNTRNIVSEFAAAFRTFFTKPGILGALAFMLLYRMPEAQLIKLIQPFLIDSVSAGGLGLSTKEVGVIYGTIGVIGLTIGGILGGIAAARKGLKFWLLPMAVCMSLSCLTFVYLSYAEAPSLLSVNVCVFVEQFGYGFGFTAYMLYLMYFSEGKYKTSHYAICTGIMALGMMLPGMAAGWIQEQLGYRHFFIYTMVCCIATISVCFIPKIDPEFGRK